MPSAPLTWITRFADRIPGGGPVLDLASGGGRHGRYLLGRGHPVTAVDIDVDGLDDIAGTPGLEIIAADLETGPWPLAGRRFAGVVVANYLWRPILPAVVAAVAPGGVLIYETFALGNERFGKPSNPDFLLRPGELLDAVRGALTVIAYELTEERAPRPAMRQRICAIRETV